MNMKKKKIKIVKVKNISNYIIQNIIDYLYVNYKYLIDKNGAQNESYLQKIYNFFIYYLKWFNKTDEKQYKVIETIINEYEIEEHLRISKYKDELFIKKIYNIWKAYLIKIFCSKTIRTVFQKICSDVCKDFKPYDFIVKEELSTIFDEIKFVQFEIEDTFGMTLTDTLTIYEYYKGLNKNYGEDDSKLVFLSFNLITNEHEVLGHLNIRIQNLINRKDVQSPKPSINSNNLLGRNETESGDYIEELLYGSSISNLYYKQILFILDIDNYDCEYTEFKKKFLNCNNCNLKISDNFKSLIKSLNIILDNPDENLRLYTITQNLSKAKESVYQKPLQHKRGAFHYSPELKMKYKEQMKHIMEILKTLKKD